MAKTYAEKLKDPRWQKKRLEILDRDEFKCADCESETGTLQIHHLYYEWNRDPWDYPDSAFVILCEHCHVMEEDNLKDAIERLVRNVRKIGLRSWEIERLATRLRIIMGGDNG